MMHGLNQIKYFFISFILFPSLLFSQPNPNETFGDLNQDNNVDVLDVLILIQIILDDITPTETHINFGDVNSDSILNVLDILIIVDVILYPIDDCDCASDDLIGNNDDWELFFSGDTSLPAFPDAYVNYFSYSLEITENTGIRLKGEFSESRYMSINVYESTQGFTLNEIYDLEIQPDCCSINPFLENISSPSYNHFYTINILPDNTESNNLENVIHYPENVDSLSIFLRYYDSFGDSFGNVELPFVSIFNPQNNEEINDPNNFQLTELSEVSQFEDILLPLFPFLQLDENIRFYNFSSGALFSNSNTSYLAAGITKSPGEVYMIRFKPPSFPENVEEYQNTESRYWSVNQGNEDTQNFYGWKDQQFIIADTDGFVNIVMAEPTEEIEQQSQGLNFFPWNIPGDNMFLIYRNLLQSSEFPGNFNQIPIFNQENINGLQDLYNFNAINYIGNYAPYGLRMTTEEFLENFGGFPVSY